MQYILRDPRGACQVDWIQDARPAPRSRSLEVNYSSNSDLANRFKVERWATFAQTWCELNLASRATNEWRYFNCSRLTVIILTVFLCKLYRIAGFYLNRTPLLFQLDRRRPSLLFPSILASRENVPRRGGLEERSSRQWTFEFASMVRVFASRKRKELFFHRNRVFVPIFLYAIRYYICDLVDIK